MNPVFKGARVLIDWFGDGAKPVPNEQAQSRAHVCTDIEWTDAEGRKQHGCPHNSQHEAWDLLTKPVAEATLRLLRIRRQLDLKVNGDARLGTCKICLCSLRLKVFVPIQPIADETDDDMLKEFPRYCWCRQEIEALKSK